MKSVLNRFSFLAIVLFSIVIIAVAQSHPAASSDPRVGLKPGYKDAGVAARNMELIKNLPKPEGFFDPKSPLGSPTPAERPEGNANPNPAAAPNGPATPAPPSGLDFANSDLAFKGEHAIMGNFNGFTTWAIEDPAKAHLLASIVCPGGQGDVSVYRNLLFMSVEQTRGRPAQDGHRIRRQR